MNNEEKILGLLERMHERLLNLEQGQAKLEQGQMAIQEDITEIKMDVAEIKEDAAITRSATNSLIEWADNVSVITPVKFPVKKSQ